MWTTLFMTKGAIQIYILVRCHLQLVHAELPALQRMTKELMRPQITHHGLH